MCPLGAIERLPGCADGYRAAVARGRGAARPAPIPWGDMLGVHFGPHNLHENRPYRFVSENIIAATYHSAGLRVFGITSQFEPKAGRRLDAGTPDRVIDPRADGKAAIQTADVYLRGKPRVFTSDYNVGLNIAEFTGP